MPKESVWWKHFEISEDRKTSKCNLCGKVIKYNSNTSANSGHLRAFHSKEHDECLREKSTPRELFATPKRNMQASNEKINTYLANALCSTYSPFRVLSNTWFRRFCKSLKFDPPSPDTFRRYIRTRAEEYVNKNRKEARKMERGWVSIDGWDPQYQQSHIYGVFIHFITGGFERRTILLGVEALDEKATAGNLTALTIRMLAKYGLDSAQIIGSVADGAANLRASLLRNAQYHVHCCSHTVALTIKKCAGLTTMKAAMEKVNGLAALLSRSKHLRSMLRERSNALNITTRLPLPFSVTRWGGCYLLAEAFLCHYQSLNVSPDLVKFQLSDLEMKHLDRFVTAVKPFMAVLTQAASDKSFLSEMVPRFSFLSKCLDQYDQKTSLIRTLNNDSKNSYEELLDNDATLMAAFLDPRYAYLKKFASDDVWEHAEGLVENYSDSLTEKSSGSNPVVNNNDDDETDEPVPKKRVPAVLSFNDFMEDGQEDEESNGGCKGEIVAYKAALLRRKRQETMSPLDFWKANVEEYPLLARTARHFLAPPLSAAVVERCFSRCRNIASLRRNRMSPRTLNDLLLNMALASIEEKDKDDDDDSDDNVDDCVDDEEEPEDEQANTVPLRCKSV